MVKPSLICQRGLVAEWRGAMAASCQHDSLVEHALEGAGAEVPDICSASSADTNLLRKGCKG